MATRGISAGNRPFPKAPNLPTVGEISKYLNDVGSWVTDRVNALDRQARTIPYAAFSDLPPLAGPPRLIAVPDDPTYGQVLCFNGVSTSGTETGWYRLIPAGTAGAPAASFPAGGTTSQVLGKKSSTDYDMEWQTPHYVPSGGTTAQALRKTGTADYAATWGDVHEVPAGGTLAQALRKTGTADYAATWSDVHEIPAGGTTSQVLAKTGTADYATAWSTIYGVATGGTAGQAYVKNSTAAGDASFSNSLGTTTFDAAISLDLVRAGGTSSYAEFNSTAAYLGKAVALDGQTTTATVGTAGAASALPAAPAGYLQLQINGTAYAMPFFNP